MNHIKGVDGVCFIMGVFLLLTVCSEPGMDLANDQNFEVTSRWYSEEQLRSGALVFAGNCAVCHGSNAEGTVGDWRQRLVDGSFPPPPLDGSAHAWHHPNSVLLQVINKGGEAFGGKMPAFAEELEESEKLAVIAYFQNFWSDEIYAQWIQMGGPN
ncbi:MAG: cytochrome c [Pseudohongiellaceae bacterium]